MTPLTRPYPKRVGPAAMPTGAAASVFQAPEKLVIQRFSFANTAATPQNVTLNIVAQGGYPATGTQIIPTLSVPAKDTLIVLCPTLLERGDQIYALADGAVNLMFNVNDRETEVL